MLTRRQEKILNKIIEDYIELAEPISSEFLKKRHNFDISSPSIRIELQKLTKQGYLYQPYISAGRVPTDKAYRFFVNRLINRLRNNRLKKLLIADWLKEFDDTIRFINYLTKELAIFSHTLVIVYLKEENIFWKEGWEQVLKEPEFKEKEFIFKFIELLKIFEEKIKNLEINSEVEIYIGKENRFLPADDLAMIISKCCFPSNKDGLVSFFGPKRMSYERNIFLIESLKNFLKNYGRER